MVAHMATYTYDITTTVGKIRRLIGDTDITPESDATFNDEEIEFYYDLAGDSILKAAALGLRAIAVSKALLEKLQRTLNWTEDTRGLANSILASALAYEEQDANTPAYAVAQLNNSDFASWSIQCWYDKTAFGG